MNKSKQLTLFPNQQKKFFGGALLYKKRKSKRPLSKKDSIHLVLRSEWAMGSNSFLAKPNHEAIKLILLRFSKKFGVKVYQQAINSNHVHILLRITNRKLYTAFIKAVSGQIASHTMAQQSFKVFASAHKNKSGHKNISAGDGSKASSEVKSAHQNPEGFWQFRPFSRIVNWGKDFKCCVNYLKQNILEAFGFVNYKARKNYYSRWIKHVAPILETG